MDQDLTYRCLSALPGQVLLCACVHRCQKQENACQISKEISGAEASNLIHHFCGTDGVIADPNLIQVSGMPGVHCGTQGMLQHQLSNEFFYQ